MFESIVVAVAGTGFIGPVHVEALRRLGIKVKGILGYSFRLVLQQVHRYVEKSF